MYTSLCAIRSWNWNWKLTQDNFLIEHWIQRTHRCSAVRCWPWGIYSSWLASRDLGTTRSSYLAWVGPVLVTFWSWPACLTSPHALADPTGTCSIRWQQCLPSIWMRIWIRIWILQCRTDDNTSPEPRMTQFTDTYTRFTSPDLTELILLLLLLLWSDNPEMGRWMYVRVGR